MSMEMTAELCTYETTFHVLLVDIIGNTVQCNPLKPDRLGDFNGNAITKCYGIFTSANEVAEEL